MKIWVLCENDFPVGVYSSDERAAEVSADYKTAREAQPGARPTYMHRHAFTLDAEARP